MKIKTWFAVSTVVVASSVWVCPNASAMMVPEPAIYKSNQPVGPEIIEVPVLLNVVEIGNAEVNAVILVKQLVNGKLKVTRRAGMTDGGKLLTSAPIDPTLPFTYAVSLNGYTNPETIVLPSSDPIVISVNAPEGLSHPKPRDAKGRAWETLFGAMIP